MRFRKGKNQVQGKGESGGKNHLVIILEPFSSMRKRIALQKGGKSITVREGNEYSKKSFRSNQGTVEEVKGKEKT